MTSASRAGGSCGGAEEPFMRDATAAPSEPLAVSPMPESLPILLYLFHRYQRPIDSPPPRTYPQRTPIRSCRNDVARTVDGLRSRAVGSRGPCSEGANHDQHPVAIGYHQIGCDSPLPRQSA